MASETKICCHRQNLGLTKTRHSVVRQIPPGKRSPPEAMMQLSALALTRFLLRSRTHHECISGKRTT